MEFVDEKNSYKNNVNNKFRNKINQNKMLRLDFSNQIKIKTNLMKGGKFCMECVDKKLSCKKKENKKENEKKT